MFSLIFSLFYGHLTALRSLGGGGKRRDLLQMFEIPRLTLEMTGRFHLRLSYGRQVERKSISNHRPDHCIHS